MKKILSVVLALAMTFALCTTVFAEDPVTPTTTVKVTTTPADNEAAAIADTNTWSIPVTSEYDNTAKRDEIADKYYVVVKWTELNNSLKYSIGTNSYTWTVVGEDATNNAEPTSAGFTVTPKWEGEANIKVEVQNWSNVAVDAKLSWAAATKNETQNVTKTIATETKFGETTGTEKTFNLDAADETITDLPTETNTAAITAMNVAKGDSTLNIKVTEGAINANKAVIGTLTITVTKAATVEP